MRNELVSGGQTAWVCITRSGQQQTMSVRDQCKRDGRGWRPLAWRQLIVTNKQGNVDRARGFRTTVSQPENWTAARPEARPQVLGNDLRRDILDVLASVPGDGATDVISKGSRES